jgi:hypothetical protein
MANKRFRILGELLVYLSRKIKAINYKLLIISLFISSLIWTLSNLIQDGSRTSDVPVSFVNAPKGLVLVNAPDSILNLELQADLLSFSMNKRKREKAINIDLTYLKPKLRDGLYKIGVPSIYFKKDLIAQLGVDEISNVISPDTLFFVFDDLIEMSLPVKVDLDVSFKNSFSQKGDLVLTPDSVKVKGPASKLIGMEFVELKPFAINDLEASKDVVIECEPAAIGVSYSHQEVSVHIEVDQFTEKRFVLPIEVKSNVPGIKIKTYPPEIEVSCQLALSDFELVTDTSFVLEVQVDSLGLLRKEPLIPRLKKQPSFVRNVQLSHEKLDYIILHK